MPGETGKGAPLQALESLIRKYPEWQIAQQILEENKNVGALILAISTPERRQAIVSRLNKAKRAEVLDALSNLKRPPDFVISTIVDSLKKTLGPSPNQA
ncbi:hypothetical protein HOF92_05065 [bacterium]|jgi:flagellar motor switch protein FliG|nr:hypothetical protein [bacterium]